MVLELRSPLRIADGGAVVLYAIELRDARQSPRVSKPEASELAR
jgi:hypothetical protein